MITMYIACVKIDTLTSKNIFVAHLMVKLFVVI